MKPFAFWTAALLSSVVVFCNKSVAAPPDKVDIFLLFDDTGSFATFAPSVTDIFSSLVDGVEAGLPGVEFGYGVGRFEDYGGPGWDYCSNRSTDCAADFNRRVNGRPFLLNQPIITSDSAGGRAQRDSLIVEALQRSNAGTGGDDPETHIEALWQIVSGAGFDANADGSVNGSDGTQGAGAVSSQIAPDQSGDVPSFSSLSPGVVSSGNIGGVGFRPEALKLVIIATEICAAIPFKAGTNIPAKIEGRYSSESISDFACFNSTPGEDRFGYIGNAPSAAQNTVANAVVPLGSANLLDTIAALNAADIRVLAMGPGLTPKDAGSGPGHEPSGFLSALARITGGVDSLGRPLVFDIGQGGEALKDKIVQAILAAASNNPGCSDQDLTPVLDLNNKSILERRKFALSLAKKSQSKTQYKKTAKKIKKLVAKAKKATQAYPSKVTVCQNKACPAESKSVQIKNLKSASSNLNKMINSFIKNIKNKKSAKKFKSKAKKMKVTGTANIGTLPDHINQCS